MIIPYCTFKFYSLWTGNIPLRKVLPTDTSFIGICVRTVLLPLKLAGFD